jgi:hypothetical protein
MGNDDSLISGCLGKGKGGAAGNCATHIRILYSKTLRFKLGATGWVPPPGMNLIQVGSFELAGLPSAAHCIQLLKSDRCS